MSPQQAISRLYPGSKCLTSAKELIRFRQENTIYIMGNGPSAFIFPEALEYHNKKYDLSGTSALSLQHRKANFYWYEPHFQYNDRGFCLSGPESASCYALARILHHEWTSEVSEETTRSLIPNPQFPTNTFGYSAIARHEQTVIPPWHFVNEKDDEHITDGLRLWLKTPRLNNNLILNFRGSIIRQISMAFMLGYEFIVLGGLDPSCSGYWYTNNQTRVAQMKTDILRRCEQACESYEDALIRTSQIAPAENMLAGPENSFYTFERSILLVLYLLSKANTKTKVLLLVSDEHIEELCSEIQMHKAENLRLVTRNDVASVVSAMM